MRAGWGSLRTITYVPGQSGSIHSSLPHNASERRYEAAEDEQQQTEPVQEADRVLLIKLVEHGALVRAREYQRQQAAEKEQDGSDGQRAYTPVQHSLVARRRNRKTLDSDLNPLVPLLDKHHRDIITDWVLTAAVWLLTDQPAVLNQFQTSRIGTRLARIAAHTIGAT
jgi:hypothetical protein